MLHHLLQKSKWTIYILLVWTCTLQGQNPNWVAPLPSNYVHNSNAIYVFYIDDLRSDHINDRLAFFVGTEIRGLSQPVSVGNGEILHFVSLHSNEINEEMTIKMYHHATNAVYPSNQKILFKPTVIYGSLEIPLAAKGYTQGDAPIGINLIPDMTTLQEVAFPALDLSAYVVQPDTNQVVYSYVPNANLNVMITGSILEITPIPGYYGTTTLIVRVTEVSVNQKVSDAAIILHVDQAPTPPVLTVIPNQGITKGEQFTDFDLGDYEQEYNGNCLSYGYVPVIEPAASPSPFPNWNVIPDQRSTMTFVIKSIYTPHHVFQNSGDRLALFTNDSLRAVSFPVQHQGSALYFVSMGGHEVETEDIEIRFYSASIQKVFTMQSQLSYEPFGAAGTVDEPIVIDFSPLLPQLDSLGNVHVEIRDTSWTGEQKFVFSAKDCKYPQYFNSNQTVSFCILEVGDVGSVFYYDADGDGFGNPAISITACSMPIASWVDNNLDCNDSDASTITLEYTLAIQETAVIPNDGHICSGTSTGISISLGFTYLWSNGSTTSSIMVNPDTTTNFAVTITSVEGCSRDTIIPITVETNVITNNQNAGPGSMRSVLECIVENGDVFFDQPINDHSILTTPLDISKNVRLIGLSPTIRPYLSLDVGINDTSMQIETGKTLTIKDVDLIIVNQNGSKPYFTGNGTLSVSGVTEVRQE
jgi:hypothetical protein